MRGLEFDRDRYENEDELSRREELRDPNHEKSAYAYYFRSRNGHREALDGVTFEDVLKRQKPDVPLEGERPGRAASNREAEPTAETPVGNVLKEALERQGVSTEGTPEKRPLQVSTPYPKYNVSFRSTELEEHPEGKEIMGKSSDHWMNRMNDALENGDMTTFRVAKNNYNKAISEEQAEAAKG